MARFVQPGFSESKRLASELCESCYGCGFDTKVYDLPIFPRPIRLCAGCRDAAEVFL